MDKMLNSKQEKETIYEIYRGCRLCGGGAGYKMPIIQNIIDLEDSDVELRQKIRECVQIEVHQDDKMPPLICELCVDKVNDFYEFLDMCRQTNKKTRLRLGLPPQSLPRGAPDAGDCILGLTEPVFIEDSDGETEQLAKHKRTKIKKEPGVKEVVVKKEIDNVRRSSKEVRKDSKKDRKEVIKEPVVRIQLEDINESRFSRSKRSRTPPRVTRLSRSNKDDDEALSSLKSDDSSTTSRKRPKDKEPVKLDTPKRVKITTKPSGQKSSPRTPPKVMKRVATPPKEEYNCDICGTECKTHQARSSHQRIHTVGFTSLKLSCNPCGDWFPSLEEASYHHKRHKSKSIPYSCNNCYSDFKTLPLYDEHLKKNECLPTYEVADMKCEECWHLFPTHNLLESHRCLGVDHRPGGKCSKCNKNYVLLKNLKKHESACTARKKGQPIVDEAILKKLLPMQVRITQCDSLLKEGRLTKCDTSNLPTDFGLDPGSFYPYLGLVRIKSEFKGMVNIEDDFKEYSPGNYLHWDSTDESDEEITCSEALNSTLKKKNIDSLTALCLKTIFSKKLLGKVPKKKRKFKPEKVFDYLNDEVKMDLDSIINNLNDENNDFNNKKDDFDSFANDNNDSGFNFDSVNGNNDSLTKFNSGNDSTPKINGDINTVNINDCAIVDFKPTDKLSVTSHSEKSQENPSEVSSVDLLMENNCQDSNLSRNSDLNKNGNKDFKFSNDCQNNDSTNDSDNIVNDNNDSSNNSKIVLSDILPKTTENDVTVNSLNNFSFDY